MSNDKATLSLTEPRFNKDTYWGRVMAIASGVKFVNAFKTVSQIEEMQKLVADQKKRE